MSLISGERGADIVDMKFQVAMLPVADTDDDRDKFADPDWDRGLLQETTDRLPGRVW